MTAILLKVASPAIHTFCNFNRENYRNFKTVQFHGEVMNLVTTYCWQRRGGFIQENITYQTSRDIHVAPVITYISAL